MRDDEPGVAVGTVTQHGHVLTVRGQAGFSSHTGVVTLDPAAVDFSYDRMKTRSGFVSTESDLHLFTTTCMAGAR